MPNMDGFELQRHINQEFCLPVILMSADSQAEVICKGIQNGAQFFLVKPIVAEDVKHIWQFSEWWKHTMNNRDPPISEIDRSSKENVGRTVAFSSDNMLTARTRKVVWTRNLHTRFVEALLVLGYHNAVPRNIVEVMNVPGLTREQVASHLQKYRQFLHRVLDGSADMESSHWFDLNYYSSFVAGNPHLMLINQLRVEHRTGKLAAPIPVGDMSSSSGGCRLPPFNPAEASSRRDPLQNLMYESNQMGYYKQNALVAPQNYSYRNGGLVGGANNNMFTSANHIGTSSTAPYHNNVYSNQAFNLGGQGSNNIFNGQNINGGQLGIVQRDPVTGISFGANQFGNSTAVNEQQPGAGLMTVQNLFNGHNIVGGQLGNVQRDPNTGISFGANQFGNTSAMNEQQLGAGGMIDQPSRSNNNEGKVGEDYWGDVMLGVANDKDVSVANEIGDDSDEDDENTRDDDADADYNPEEEC